MSPDPEPPPPPESAERPVLSIVIPSWNTKELLAPCLDSIARATRPATEIVMVDNGSADGSADWVAEHHPEVVLVRNAENRGFAGGCNQGMALARGRFVLLLNTDTELAPNVLAEMIGFLEEHPDYGCCAPRLIHPDGRTQRTVQAFPTLKTALFFSTPLERWFPESRELRRYFLRDWDQESTRDVDQPPAACLMVRAEVLERVGHFDEELWLFYNDVDLSLRIKQAGWKTRYLAELEVVHHVGASTSKFAAFLPMWQKNRLAFYRKHHGRLGSVWIKGYVTFSYVDWLVTQLWRRLRGKPADPLGDWSRQWWAFLGS